MNIAFIEFGGEQMIEVRLQVTIIFFFSLSLSLCKITGGCGLYLIPDPT
jgi:hypothetical protein